MILLLYWEFILSDEGILLKSEAVLLISALEELRVEPMLPLLSA